MSSVKLATRPFLIMTLLCSQKGPFYIVHLVLPSREGSLSQPDLDDPSKLFCTLLSRNRRSRSYMNEYGNILAIFFNFNRQSSGVMTCHYYGYPRVAS